MKDRTKLQMTLGGTFLAMGIGTICFPALVIEHCFNPAFFDNTAGERAVVGCFGAQAALQGVLLLSCEMTRETWRNWGLAILPFVAFDIYACPYGPFPICTWLGAIGDGLGNIVFLGCCLLGYNIEDNCEGQKSD